MPTKFIRFVSISAILIITFGTNGVARAEPASQKLAAVSSVSAATSPWFTGWADKNTSADVGSYPSIAYNPADGLPYISYYDAVHKNLLLASPVTSGGNCGDGNKWWCRVVDGDGTAGGKTNGNVGQYSSIAFWEGALFSWKLGISYHDAKNNALKVAIWTQSLLGGSWTYMTIDSSTSATDEVGTYTSIKFTSTGTPIIAYYNHVFFQGIGFGQLNLAMPTTGTGNCGPGNTWQCDQVDGEVSPGVGQYASLGIGYNDEMYMAYYDALNGDLKYAYYATPGNGNCGTANAYSCTMVAGAGADVGISAALTAPRSSTDKVRIAYYNNTAGYLDYATQDFTGSGNCSGGWWSCIAIQPMGAGLTQAGISMALDPNGIPLIAYEDDTNDPYPSVLGIARYVAMFGNCGPISHIGSINTPSWQCDTIDNAAYGSGYVNLAKYASVAISSSGLATIAYYENDSYYSTDYLKVAYQRFQAYLPLIKR